MISVEVNCYIDVYNITIFERSARWRLRKIPDIIVKRDNSLVWDPVTQNIVDARATGFRKARIE